MISVMFSCDNTYAPYTGVVMGSILVNLPANAQIHFYVLGDCIQESGRQSMIDTINKTKRDDISVSLSIIPIDNSVSLGDTDSRNIPKSIYSRLFLDRYLPKNLDRILYLDSDVLVMDDITKLWNQSLDGMGIGAVADYGIMASKRCMKSKVANLDMSMEDVYFNAGVLLIDLEYWKENNIGNQLISFFHKKVLEHLDQDALNYVFKGRWKELDQRWNTIPPVSMPMLKVFINSRYRKIAKTTRKNIAIYHWAGKFKPWQKMVFHTLNDQYHRFIESHDLKIEFIDTLDKKGIKNKRRSLLFAKILRFVG